MYEHFIVVVLISSPSSLVIVIPLNLHHSLYTSSPFNAHLNRIIVEFIIRLLSGVCYFSHSLVVSPFWDFFLASWLYSFWFLYVFWNCQQITCGNYYLILSTNLFHVFQNFCLIFFLPFFHMSRQDDTVDRFPYLYD